MPDSLLPPPSGQDIGRTVTVPATVRARPAGRPTLVLVLVLAAVFAAFLPATAAFIAWQMQSIEQDLAALHLSAQLRVTADTLEQQARAALREAPDGMPMPAWYVEELRRQAPACSRMVDALAARDLPPALTGLARNTRFTTGETASRRMEANAASWLAVRHQIEPALRPGSADPAVRAAAVTLEALGPMVVESSADLSRALRDALRDRWRLLAAAQWTLAAAMGAASLLLVLLAMQRLRSARRAAGREGAPSQG